MENERHVAEHRNRQHLPDGFRTNDHEQILSCLTDDIEWTVFGAFHLNGKQAYDKAIAMPRAGPDFLRRMKDEEKG